VNPHCDDALDAQPAGAKADISRTNCAVTPLELESNRLSGIQIC
jgi:hypothetical protein